MASKTSKKLQEHITILRERQAHQTLEMEELLKQNSQPVKVEKKKESKVKALKRELG